ncbi:MAG TPA: S8 family serine peptidase [Thermoanaerobaculia bacterium]|nr:S8 family serine peptidase [Thermoanaerobaculia bacterium]
MIVAVGLPETRHQAMLSLRADVVQSLETATRVEPWGTSAAFAAELDRNELELLELDPRVRAISIDRGGEGALLESVPLVGADAVHARGFDGRGVTVAILDSGIDVNSRDFAGRIVGQRCFCDNLDGTGCCPNGEASQVHGDAAQDDNGHGTHVAGIVAGNGANAPRGIAPGARILAVKVLDHNRGFRSFTQVYRALEWIARERPDVKVINMSFGSWQPFAPDDCDSAAIAIGMQTVVTELRRRGVLITASSGNQSYLAATTIPACMRDVIGVGATYDSTGEQAPTCDVAWPSERDAVACFTNSSTAIDLVAPGAFITSTGRGAAFATMYGTSMAAPHVAGALALMQQVSAGKLTAEQAEAILKNTGRPTLDARNGLVFPRLDVAAAVAATPYVPQAPPQKRRAARK